MTQAVSVAAAYFEDTLGMAPGMMLSAGTMGAEPLGRVLANTEFEGIAVREMVSPAAIEASATTSGVPRSWMAGVRGALKS